VADPVAQHAALLREIECYDNEADNRECSPDYCVHTPIDALRAVVELHRPEPCPPPCSLRHEHLTCLCCRGMHWPCNTIEKITGELGVSTS
jgi:hypothetical protein